MENEVQADLNQDIFREYDIRGVVDKDFDASFAKTLGMAFASYMKKNHAQEPLTVTVGHDARLSSPKLFSSMCEGLSESGVNVIQIGLVTSPISYFSTFIWPIGGAVMITGSHNP